MLGLSCYSSFSLVVASGDYSLVSVSGLLTVGGFSCCRIQALGVWASVVSAAELQRTGSVFVMHRLGCSSACGIFLDQGLIPCLLHWQADSLPLHHQGSTIWYFWYLFLFIYSIWPCQVFAATCGMFSCSMWDLVPDQGLNALPSSPTPRIGSTRVLVTEPPGKSPSI